MINLLKIKEIAEQKKVTMKEIAEALNMSRQGLNKVIDGGSTKISTLEKIAEILDVPITIFFEKGSDVTNSCSDGIAFGSNAKLSEVTNNSGHHNNFFTPDKVIQNYISIIAEKDCRIEELSRQVEFLQNLTNNLMSRN